MQTKTRITRAKTRSPFGPRNVGLLLGIILLGAFYPVLIAGETFCYRDFGVLAIPTAAYHRASIWSGELPLWNPYSNCGVPFLAQWGTMVLYPLSLIYVLLPMPWSLNLFCILHLWVGGMGMYYLARSWMNDERAAAVAAVGFIATGITQAALSWPNYIAALGLLPWVVLTVQAAWDTESRPSRHVCAAALISAAQLLTGVPEIAILTWAVITLLWIPRLVTSASHRSYLILKQVVIVGGATALCAAQLLPFLQLLHHSQRAAGFAAEKWALPLWGWANLILPRFHTFTTPEGTVFQYGQEFLSSVYVGAPLLVFAAFALGNRDVRIRMLSILTLLAAVLAFGSGGFLYAAVVRVFPFIGIARYPVKFLFLLSFTMPLLAACGLKELLAADRARAQKLLTGALVLMAVAMGILVALNVWQPFRYDRVGEFVANSLARFGWLVLVIACLKLLRMPRLEPYADRLGYCTLILLAFDGFTHLRNQNPVVSSALFEPNVWAASQKFQKPEHGLGRAFITTRAEAKLLHSNIADLNTDITGKRLALWSHLNLLDGVPKVNGSATLQLRDQAAVQKFLYSETNTPPDVWLDFLNVTIQSATNSPIEWEVRQGAMPFLTGGQRPLKRAPGMVENPPRFSMEVVLEPWEDRFKDFVGGPITFSDVEFRTTEVRFTARTEKAAFAVLPESWHPAWRAEVIQGAKAVVSDTPVLKANTAFQAVELPAGESRVRIYYHDSLFQIGAAISVLTFLAGSTVAFRGTPRPRAQK